MLTIREKKQNKLGCLASQTACDEASMNLDSARSGLLKTWISPSKHLLHKKTSSKAGKGNKNVLFSFVHVEKNALKMLFFRVQKTNCLDYTSGFPLCATICRVQCCHVAKHHVEVLELWKHKVPTLFGQDEVSMTGIWNPALLFNNFFFHVSIMSVTEM